MLRVLSEESAFLRKCVERFAKAHHLDGICDILIDYTILAG
jgi:hypothetical protein